MGVAGAGAGPQRCLKKSGKSVEAYQNWHPFFRVAMEFPVEGLNNFLLNRAIETLSDGGGCRLICGSYDVPMVAACRIMPPPLNFVEPLAIDSHSHRIHVWYIC